MKFVKALGIAIVIFAVAASGGFTMSSSKRKK
jgi:hypothetical protein